MTVTHSTQSPPSTCSRRRTTSKPSRTLVVRKESLTSIVRRRLDELQPVRFKMCLQFVEEARFGRRVGVKSLPRETCAARELCDFIFQIRPSLKVILCDRGVVNAFVFAKANADAPEPDAPTTTVRRPSRHSHPTHSPLVPRRPCPNRLSVRPPSQQAPNRSANPRG